MFKVRETLVYGVACLRTIGKGYSEFRKELHIKKGNIKRT
jgi:hypothetical protein